MFLKDVNAEHLKAINVTESIIVPKILNIRNWCLVCIRRLFQTVAIFVVKAYREVIENVEATHYRACLTSD